MVRSKPLFLCVATCILLAACAAPPGAPLNDPAQPQPSADTGSAPTPGTQSQATEAPITHSDAPHTSDVDLTRLTVGDGQYSTSPQVGFVFSCQTQFTGGGASGTGNWMNGDGTWDLTKKAIVDGSVQWPHSFTIDVQGDQRVFTGNDLPDHTTGIYPISPGDDAYAVDRNPNSIGEQSVNFSVPANPVVAAQPTCVGGEVGIMLSGVMLFNAFDAAGRDAGAHEVQDACDGHPQASGFYHYHNLSDCLEDSAAGHSSLMGYAFDGFGIYGLYGEDGRELTNEDLDECHGHMHLIEWDSQPVELYHYHATHEFPYMVGCFRGTPSIRALTAGEGPGGMQDQGGQTQPGVQQGGAGQPPQEAISACAGLSQGANCSVGPITGTCQTPPNSTQLACVPAGGPPP